MLRRSLLVLVALAGCAGPTEIATVVIEPLAAGEGGVEIAGSVTDLNTGAGIENALLVLTCTCLRPGTVGLEISTKADGSYRVKDLRPGRYNVQMLSGLVEMEREVSVSAGTRGRVDFRIVPRRFRLD